MHKDTAETAATGRHLAPGTTAIIQPSKPINHHHAHMYAEVEQCACVYGLSKSATLAEAILTEVLPLKNSGVQCMRLM